MLDFTINVPTIIAGIGAVVGIVFWFARLEGRVTANDKAVVAIEKATEAWRNEVEKLIATLEAQIALNRDQLHEFKLQSAKEFTTREVIAEIKHDFGEEIGKLEIRLTEQINRLAPR